MDTKKESVYALHVTVMQSGTGLLNAKMALEATLGDILDPADFEVSPIAIPAGPHAKIHKLNSMADEVEVGTPGAYR